MELQVTHEELSGKRKNTDSTPVPNKKSRKFCAKEFRNLLKSSVKLNALKEFLENLNNNSTENFAEEYLKNGGSLQEILHCLEDTDVSPVLVLDIVNSLLLKIIKCGLNYVDEAYQACRNFLQTSASVIDKMLGLTSSTLERIVILKFLTTMATNSSQLSKDILSYVNFNLSKIEFLSISRVETKTVRKHFVYFLTALLIDIEYPVLSLLLSKKGLLTSIVPGLIYDESDTVCFIITAMKNSILENPFVSKTVKMKTFNTIVVKNIVNLYNWKGPSNLKHTNAVGSSNSKNGEVAVSTKGVDEVEKAKVSKCAHDFLLTLCTSHKYGVIFRDPLVGMGKKTQNALIYTVVDSMDSPWVHSYASELVLKICSACPDITKYIWNSIKTLLEPRFSPKWLILLDFAKKLLEEVKPSFLQSYITNLSPNQIYTVITSLVAPIPVLKVVLPENGTYDLQVVKYRVLDLLSSMLKCITNYLSSCTVWLEKEKLDKLKDYVQIHIERNFPSVEMLLQNWNIDSCNEDQSINIGEYLSVVFDIFEYYSELCPDLLSSHSFSQEDLKRFLESVNHKNDAEKKRLQIKIIDIYLSFNPDLFSLETDSFNFFLSNLLRNCYENANDTSFKVFSVLRKLFRNTGIFDDVSDREIDVWISGIFSLKSYKDAVAVFITDSLKLSKLRTKEYLKLFSEFQNAIDDHDSPLVTFNPMVFAILDQSSSVIEDKTLSSYANFVLCNFLFQSDFRIFPHIISKMKPFNSLEKYIDSMLSDTFSFEIPKTLKIFGRENVFNSFNLALAGDSFEKFVNENLKMLYPNLYTDLLQMGLFYLTRLDIIDNETKLLYTENLLFFVKYLSEIGSFDYKMILNNSWLIQNFSILNGEPNYCTKFLMDSVDCLSKKFNLLDADMKYFHKKLTKMIYKILKNPRKYDTLEVVDIIDKFRLTSEIYTDVLIKISDCLSKNHEKSKFKSFFSILIHTMEKHCQMVEGKPKILTKEILENVLSLCTSLNGEGEIKTQDLSKHFFTYFSEFPAHLDYIQAEFVKSILSLREYQKANTDLVVLILRKRNDLVACVEENLEDLVFVKGMLYPVLNVLIEKYRDAVEIESLENLFLKIYNNLEEVIEKTLKKPQKASQHLDIHYEGVCFLIDLYFRKEKFQQYVSKVLKFEVTKIFHVHMLNTIFKKFFSLEIDNASVINTVLTFTHFILNILKRLDKTEESLEETLNTVCEVIISYLGKLGECKDKYDFGTIQSNETFKILIKYLLKYGVSDHQKLLELLESLLLLLGKSFEDNHVELIMDMLISHSTFLDVLLSENHKCKKGVLSLMTTICESWPQFMTRSHIPKLLSSYRATVAETDRMTFKLIKMYESVRDTVSFQDFRPYLWGNDGAIHYSVRIDIEKAILKQPKVKDVLNILQDNMVLSTIKNYHLYKSGKSLEDLDLDTIYDLEFLIPLFIHLLSHENVVQTYQFARSGALSLTLLGLSSPEENMRAATCDVLSRFHFHLESKQRGKDNFLYMKLITSICMWMSNSKSAMNNFASIFLARTALILSKPFYNNAMLPQLSRYLVVKDVLDLSNIPELYTYLGSSDVNYKEHLRFIFEILIDGLVLDTDFKIFTKSMALKRLTELYSTRTCAKDTRLTILDIFLALCRSKVGVKLICVHSGLLQFLYMDLENNLIPKESDCVLLNKIDKIVKIVSQHPDMLNKINQKTLSSIMKKIENCK